MLNVNVWEKWSRWVALLIPDLRRSVDDNHVFTEFHQLCVENEEWLVTNEGGFFCYFVFRSYAAAGILGVRRQLKRNDNSVSLVMLLEDLRDVAAEVTMDFYLERFPQKDNGPPWQTRAFGKLSADGKVLSSSVIEEDLVALRSIGGKLETYADRRLAHLDRRFAEDPRLTEIGECIEGFAKVARKYVVFLTGEDWGEFKAGITFDWKRVFRYPMIMPRETGDGEGAA